MFVVLIVTRYGWSVVSNGDACVLFFPQRTRESASRMKTESFTLNCKKSRYLGELFSVLEPCFVNIFSLTLNKMFCQIKELQAIFVHINQPFCCTGFPGQPEMIVVSLLLWLHFRGPPFISVGGHTCSSSLSCCVHSPVKYCRCCFFPHQLRAPAGLNLGTRRRHHPGLAHPDELAACSQQTEETERRGQREARSICRDASAVQVALQRSVGIKKRFRFSQSSAGFRQVS